MHDNGDPSHPEIPRPWQPRFSIGTLLLVMLVLSVMAAAASYFMRSLKDSSHAAQLTFLIFTLVAPVLLLVIVSLLRQIVAWLSRRR